MPAVELDTELQAARSAAVWWMVVQGWDRHTVAHRLRRCQYEARHCREAVRYAAQQLRNKVFPTADLEPNQQLGVSITES